MTSRLARCRGDRGALSVWVVILVPTLILVAGLVVDGGTVMSANERAQNVAEEAARAGADNLSDAALRNGTTDALDPHAAHAAAQIYLQRADVTGTASVSGNTVTVSTTIDQPLQILTMVGMRTKTVHGHARAHSIGGITKELP